METQIEAIRNVLIKKNASAMLLESKAMKRHLGTLTGGGCAVFITLDAAQLLFDGRYLVEAQTKENRLALYCIGRGKKELYQYIQSKIGNNETILVESELSHQNYMQMKQIGLNVVLCGDEMLALRSIKSLEAMKKIEHVVTRTDEIFQNIVQRIQPGMSERELCAYVYYECFSGGANAMAFEPIVTSGERTAWPHGRASDRTINRNEPIMIDFGIEIDGYESDMTRMISIGSPSSTIKHIYDVVLEAQVRAIEAIASGKLASEIDWISRDVIAAAGYDAYYVHGLGHGIGVDNGSEQPILHASSNQVLYENMVMTCEPGIYVPNVGGVRIEDIVTIKNGKGISMTSTPKDEILILER